MTRRGFTIIELLVVVTIIALLTGLIAVSIGNTRMRQRDAKRLSDVVLIGKAIDQSALVNRGLYPRNVNYLNNPDAREHMTMCAGEIWSTANPNNIDLSLFPGSIFPTDPNPVRDVTTGCTGIFHGYIYHSHWNISLYRIPGVPTSPNDEDYGNAAGQFNLAYVLAVGLEQTAGSEASAYKRPSQLTGGGAGTTGDYYEDLSEGVRRERYWLMGPNCGTNCYD